MIVLSRFVACVPIREVSSFQRVYSSHQALDDLKEELLSQTIDFKKSFIDPAPFQLVERTNLYKIHSLFSILCLSHAYVTSIGRLVGVVTLKDVSKKQPARTFHTLNLSLPPSLPPSPLSLPPSLSAKRSHRRQGQAPRGTLSVLRH